MTNHQPLERAFFRIPPYVILGAVFIFLPIVVFITYQNIERQYSHTHQLLLEKGAALIRSFEAGTRAGMRGRLWGNRKLQQLLEETAQQSDIIYLMVTDDEGIIIAHNDESRIGEIHDNTLDMNMILNMTELQWRIIDKENKKQIFEVYREFKPTGTPGMPGRVRRFTGRRHSMAGMSGSHRQVNFIGLDTRDPDKATKAAIINSI